MKIKNRDKSLVRAAQGKRRAAKLLEDNLPSEGQGKASMVNNQLIRRVARILREE